MTRFDFKSTALIVAAIVLLPGCGQSNSKAQKKGSWTYRMQGNLDDKNLQCTGDASSQPDSGNSRCWTWQVLRSTCKGSKDVDWLHEAGTMDTVCPVNDGWELKKSLNGRAFCAPSVVLNGQAPVSLTLACTWECRDPQFPCAGSATYEYHKGN